MGIESHAYLKVSRIPTLNPSNPLISFSTNLSYNVFTTKFTNWVVDRPEIQNQNAVFISMLQWVFIYQYMKGKKNWVKNLFLWWSSSP